MAAIRFTLSEQRTEGYMLLVRQTRVRALRCGIFMFNERALLVLDARHISYERIPMPLSLDEVTMSRDTPAVPM